MKIVRTTCHACGVCACGALVHVRNGKVVKIKGDPENPRSRGFLCPKGLNYTELLYHKDRLKYPMKKVGESWQRISWDEALETIANRLMEIKEKYGPQSIVAESIHISRFPLLARLLRSLGSPNMTECLDKCDGPQFIADVSIVGEVIIHNRGLPSDYLHSKCILIWGCNPPHSHLMWWKDILEAKAKGAKLIAVDPVCNEAASKANLWLQIRPGTDAALGLAILNVIINEGLYHKAFVDKWCVGFEKLEERVKEYPPEKVAEVTSIPAEQIKKVARTIATNTPISFAPLRNGLMQQYNSTQTSLTHTILVAITGSLDVQGGHLLPKKMEGYISPEDIIHESPLPKEIEQERLIGVKDFPLYPKCCDGAASNIELRKAMLRGDVKADIICGSNPVLSNPNTTETYEALQKLELLVVSDFFMTPTAEISDIVLPSATWLERDDIMGELSYQYLSVQQKAIEPVGECRPDAAWIIELAKRMKVKDFPFKSVEEYNNYRLKKTGMTFEDFKRKGIVSFRRRYKEYEESGFKTPSGKVELYSSLLEKHGYDPLPHYKEPPESPISSPKLAKKYPLILSTGRRNIVYYHSDGRMLSWARKICPDPEILIHSDTAAKRGIKNGDWVWIETIRGRIKQKARLIDGIHPMMVSVQTGWWFPEKLGPEHGCFESNPNVLTANERIGPITGNPIYKALLCEIRKVE